MFGQWIIRAHNSALTGVLCYQLLVSIVCEHLGVNPLSVNYSSLLAALSPIVNAASNEIIEVYRRDPEVHKKADDSPVTDADLRANVIILAGLARLTPDIPIISEETAAASFQERQHWKRYWLVDPLDGTREFIKRNDEFTLNIALIENNRVCLGIVGLPIQKVIYAGIVPQKFAVKIPLNAQPVSADTYINAEISARPLDKNHITLLTSRSFIGGSLKGAISRFTSKFSGVEIKAVGSSLKLCLLAEGRADLYPKLGPTSEWDTAAGQAVLEAAGGGVLTRDGAALRYNLRESLLNPDFIAVSDPDYDWKYRAPMFFE